jgi:NADH-quinone oxidoreductase subunit L
MEFALLFLPLLASITSGFFGKYIGDRNSEIIKLLSIAMRVMWLLLLGLIQEHLM